MLLQLNIKYS